MVFPYQQDQTGGEMMDLHIPRSQAIHLSDVRGGHAGDPNPCHFLFVLRKGNLLSLMNRADTPGRVPPIRLSMVPGTSRSFPHRAKSTGTPASEEKKLPRPATGRECRRRLGESAAVEAPYWRHILRGGNGVKKSV